MIKVTALIFVAALAGYGFHALAQPRVDTRLPLTPIGTSSSNGISFAWFYDSTGRTVYVCRTGQAAPETVGCKASTTLP